METFPQPRCFEDPQQPEVPLPPPTLPNLPVPAPGTSPQYPMPAA